MKLRPRLPVLGMGLSFLALMTSPEACSIYDDSLVSGVSGSANGGDASVGPCAHVKPPAAPGRQPVGTPVDLSFALSVFDFGEHYIDPELDGGERPTQDYGYDLDNTCTGPATLGLGEGESCRPVSWTKPETQDFKDGRDNGLNRMIAAIADSLEGFGTPSYNDAIKKGRVSILLEVNGYNQTPNDDQVELNVYTAAPFDALSTGTDKPVPKFDGTDVWPITSTSYETDENGELKLPLKARFTDPGAYVVNGMLVGRLRGTDLRLSIGVTPSKIVELVFNLVQSFYTADLVYDAQKKQWQLKNGTIAARWPVQNLFNQLDQFPDPEDVPAFRRPLCTNTFGYASFRRKICASVDILSGVGIPSDPCDAISMGIHFEAVPAKRGDTYTLAPLTPKCPDEFSPSHDSCDQAFDGGVFEEDAGSSGGSGGTAGSSGAGGNDASVSAL